MDFQAEDYAQTVLVLCLPFRTKTDLMHEGSYVSKFRLVSKDISNTYGTLLQNIQDIRNAVRCKCHKDELERETEAFRSETNPDDSENEDELDDNERQYLDGLFANMTSLDDTDVNQNAAPPDINDPSLKIPTNFSLHELQNKGAHKCGYKNFSDFKYSGDDPLLIEIEEEQLCQNSSPYSSTEREYPQISVESMQRVLITTVQRKVDKSTTSTVTDEISVTTAESVNKSTTVSDEISVTTAESVNLESTKTKFKMEATGTVESMKLRAKQVHFDNNQ